MIFISNSISSTNKHRLKRRQSVFVPVARKKNEQPSSAIIHARLNAEYLLVFLPVSRKRTRTLLLWLDRSRLIKSKQAPVPFASKNALLALDLWELRGVGLDDPHDDPEDAQS